MSAFPFYVVTPCLHAFLDEVFMSPTTNIDCFLKFEAVLCLGSQDCLELLILLLQLPKYRITNNYKHARDHASYKPSKYSTVRAVSPPHFRIQLLEL